MKKLRAFILSFVICLSLLFVLSYGYIHFFAKNHITSLLQDTLDNQITIEEITYAFPFGLTLKNITLPSHGKIQEVQLFLSPKSCFSKNIRIANINIVRPKIKLTPYNLNSMTTSSNSDSDPTLTTVDKNLEKNTITIKNINVQDGELIVSTNIFTELQGHLNHIVIPLTAEQTDFALRGQYTHNHLSALMQTHGWINWLDRDMHAKLILFQETTKNELNLDLTSQTNDLTAHGIIKIVTMLDQGFVNNPIFKALLQNSLNSNQAIVQTKFSFQTKLDQPKVEKINFYGDVVTDENPI